jgi:hypothetical protein
MAKGKKKIGWLFNANLSLQNKEKVRKLQAKFRLQDKDMTQAEVVDLMLTKFEEK